MVEDIMEMDLMVVQVVELEVHLQVPQVQEHLIKVLMVVLVMLQFNVVAVAVVLVKLGLMLVQVEQMEMVEQVLHHL